MKKWMFLLLQAIAAIACQPMLADGNAGEARHEFAWQGIKYRVIDEEAKTCMTKPRIYIQGVGYDYSPFTDGVLDIPMEVYDGTTAYKVIEIGDSSFVDVTNIKKVKLPSCIESIGNFSFRNTDLKMAELHSGVKFIGAMAFCNSMLESIQLPIGLTTIGASAFANTYISTIELPVSLKSIGGAAFKGCRNIKHMILPESIDTLRTGLFAECVSLESLTIPDNIKSIEGSVFFRCKSLESIEFPSSLTYLGDDVLKGCEKIKTLYIPNTVEYIGSGAFSGCTSLKDVHMPMALVYMGGETFLDCKNLTSIEIPDGVKIIHSYSFANCSKLADIKLPEGLETIGSMAFNGCSLEDIEFPETLKIIEIGEDLHEGPGTEHYYAGTFANNKFKRLVFPDGMESIGTQAFEKCHNLEYVRLPKHLRRINEGTFSDCENLKEIVLPESLEFIGKYAFANCSSLKSIEVPNGVKTLKADWYYDPYTAYEEEAYYPLSSGLWYLKKLTLPESLEALSAAVFSGSSIEEVYYLTSSPKNIENIYGKWNYGTFSNNTYQNGILYVGIGGSAAARMTEPWKNFVNIKEIDLSGVGEVPADVCGGSILPLEVYDLQGRKIAESEVGLPSGLYIIKEGDIVRKVMK